MELRWFSKSENPPVLQYRLGDDPQWHDVKSYTLFFGSEVEVCRARSPWDEDPVDFGYIETKPTIPWDAINERWVCAAKDAEGDLVVGSGVLVVDGETWKANEGKKEWWFDDGIFHVAPGTCDWRDSLVWRPGHEPEGK